jgi:maltooligosyltrehalose trehalohydrolase
MREDPRDLGARVLPGGTGVSFRVWAPRACSVELELVRPAARRTPLEAGPDGLFHLVVPDLGAGADYFFILDGERRRPDPRSRHQPEGVHGPSRVVDPASFRWTDRGWRGRPFTGWVLYELHVGTFTSEGTFEAVIARLPHLVDLGVTAVEIMPVAEFPGGRNWGYDGVHLYAPQSSYGGPEGLHRLVDACHGQGLAFVLDVVYNHLGPEGNYLGEYGPYFSDRYHTPWGDAVNFDGPDSDPVRGHFIDNALMWARDYHVDALRLDAVHGIFDFSARHVLEELRSELGRLAGAVSRPLHLIAESDLNDVRVIAPPERGGWGHDAQWSDDFHHAARALLTGERRGYFGDYGTVADLGKAITEGFVYDGRYSAYRRRRHGNSAADRPGEQFVVCLQNHDQVANATQGARLASILDADRLRLGAALLACVPSLPLLFQGEEWGTKTPFYYFISYDDPALNDAVRRGRRAEHEDFVAAHERAAGGPGEAFADPVAPATFAACRLDWDEPGRPAHAQLLALHRALFALRRDHPSLGNCRRDLTRVSLDQAHRTLVLVRQDPGGETATALFNLSDTPRDLPLAGGPGRHPRLLSTCEARFGGDEAALPPAAIDVAPGPVGRVGCPPWSAAVYLRNELS